MIMAVLKGDGNLVKSASEKRALLCACSGSHKSDFKHCLYLNKFTFPLSLVIIPVDSFLSGQPLAATFNFSKGVRHVIGGGRR